MKTIQPQYMSTVLSLFDHVFRMTVDYKGDRVVQCQPNSDFMACTSLKLDATEQPNIQAMLLKSKGK
jgi:hypothetical protein